MASFQPNSIQGPIAAILTPRTESGEIDREALIENCRFVLASGARGLCLSGATGEYAAASEQERVETVEWVRAVVPGDRVLLAGTGAADMGTAIRLARRFEAAGADVLLTPVPHFFPYPEAEIEEYYRVFAAATGMPVVIYNLPAFTGGVPAEVVRRLIESVPNIAGVKDSSGQTEILRMLTGLPELGARRLIGNDSIFREVLSDELVDGCVSGVAGVLPELTVACFGEAPAVGLRLLEDLIPRLSPFPVPWGLKLMAEARGFFTARHAMPVSSGMEQQIGEFHDWFGTWWTLAQAALAAGAPAIGSKRI